MTWTTEEIPDQTGRVAVVTGANSGLGAATSRELARAGAAVVLACRNIGKGEEVAAEIRRQAPSSTVEVAELDLADLTSVRAFAKGLHQERLDLLVNNAGLMAVPRRETKDGFEMQIGVNHLGHFALTGLLLERLERAPEPRVVTVSSVAHRTVKGINFDDLNGEKRYFRWTAYGQSKLANLLFAFELERRAAASGSPLRSMAAHPGYAATNLQTRGDGGNGLLTRAEDALMWVTNRVFAQSEEMGALPTLYAATDAGLPGSSYVGPDGKGEQRGHPQLVGTSGAAQDTEAARRLWELSEQLTQVHPALGREESSGARPTDAPGGRPRDGR
ncbi:MAG: oxidoreductase [Actinomycetota bacterium]|nr:oxidoreductase [Actinomycetota bacterium]